MSQSEMVAMLRSMARKISVQTSHFRGVSLLKQTHRWHAQINVGGRQVSLAASFLKTQEQPEGIFMFRLALLEPCANTYLILNRELEQQEGKDRDVESIPKIGMMACHLKG